MLIIKPHLRPVAVLVAMILVVAVITVIPGWSRHSQQNNADSSRLMFLPPNLYLSETLLP